MNEPSGGAEESPASTGRSARRHRFGVTEGLFLLVAVLGAIVIVQLSRTSGDAHHEARGLEQVRTAAYAASALEWQATADPSEVASLTGRLDSTLEAADQVLDGLDSVPDEVDAAFGQYTAAVRRQFDLLKGGQLDEGALFDEEVVDPAFESLEDELLSSTDTLERRADRDQNRLRIGAIAILLTTVLLITFISRRASALERRLVSASERQEADRRARQELEGRVIERTADLARANRHNELILDSAGDGIIGLDGAGRVTFANAVAQHMLGRNLHELLGRPAHQEFHHSHPDGSPYPEEECPLTTVLADGTNVRGAQDYLVRADGTFFPIEYAASAMVEDDKVAGLVQVFRDISERRAVEQMKDEFVSVVSHELRTPLTSIRGSLGLLASGKLGELAPQGQRMVDIAVENTDRLIRLINDILDIERIDSGTVAMHKKECQAAELIAQAMLVITPTAKDAGVRVELAQVAGRLWADPDRIIQTLTNLISNAVKFSPTGGVVTVAARRDGDELRFSVSDQGRGVPQEKLETIFGRFQQVDASDAREKGGTGLGLAISRSIVEQHDGRIWAESEEGAGATFIFAVPALPERSMPPAVIAEDNPNAPIVLVCDDDVSVTEVLQAMLASHGYRTVVAGSGTEALERARSDRPAVIVLDLFMPGMDGWRTFEALKADPDTAEIPVVVLSVAARDEGGDLAQNVESWLTKPILDIRVLMQTIEGVVKEQRRPRVLIVEDDADLASVLIASFEQHGVQVVAAATEREALDQCRQFIPDLVILDLCLPDGDGFTIVDQLRRDGRLNQVPLVVYTALEIDDEQRQRLRLGNATIFFKSRVPPEIFEQRVMTLLDRVTAAAEGAEADG